MNSKFKIWLQAARLRTLPLSLSGIIVGNGLAYGSDRFSLVILVLSLATTIAFQVLSNFANDYGDGVKGTDNESRIGPARVLQQGLLTTSRAEKRNSNLCSSIAMVFAFALIYVAFGTSDLLFSLIFILLGIASVVAAIKYTVGTNAYGYRALRRLICIPLFWRSKCVGFLLFASTRVSN